MRKITKILSNQKGVALGFVLILTLAMLAIGGAILSSSLSDFRQSAMHKENVSANIAAESGAEIAHEAFKLYIMDLNEIIAEEYTEDEIADKVADRDNFITLLGLGPLGDPPDEEQAVFHLNLDADNDYLLEYNDEEIINSLGDDKSFSATITLTSLGLPSTEPFETGNFYNFPFHFVIDSYGHQDGAIPGKSHVRGEGTSTVRISTGNYARFALFTDSHESKVGSTAYFANIHTFTGPVFSNSKLRFTGHLGNPAGTFYGTVNSAASSADYISDAEPLFHRGFYLNSQPESMPVELGELRTTVLPPDGEPPENEENNPLYMPEEDGGIYLPDELDEWQENGNNYRYRDGAAIELQEGEENKQKILINKEIETFSAGSWVPYDTETWEITIDHATGTTTATLDDEVQFTRNYIPRTLFVEGEISSIGGNLSEECRLTIGARDNITITDHIEYAENPIDNPEAKNVLGLLSETKNVQLGRYAPDDIVISAVIMAAKGAFQHEDWDDLGGDRGDVNLIGGTITGYHEPLYNTSNEGYGRNYMYDPRMSDIRNIPLGFPRTDRLQVTTVRDDDIDTLELIIWERKR